MAPSAVRGPRHSPRLGCPPEIWAASAGHLNRNSGLRCRSRRPKAFRFSNISRGSRIHLLLATHRPGSRRRSCCRRCSRKARSRSSPISTKKSSTIRLCWRSSPRSGGRSSGGRSSSPATTPISLSVATPNSWPGVTAVPWATSRMGTIGSTAAIDMPEVREAIKRSWRAVKPRSRFAGRSTASDPGSPGLHCGGDGTASVKKRWVKLPKPLSTPPDASFPNPRNPLSTCPLAPPSPKELPWLDASSARQPSSLQPARA